MAVDISGYKRYGVTVCFLALAGGLLYYGCNSLAGDNGNADKACETQAAEESGKRDVYKEEALKKAAESGDVNAQYQLGKYFHELYKKAEYTSQERDSFGKETVKWLKKAAEKGMADAQLELNNYYMHTWNNYIEAAYWLDKAVQQNAPEAYYQVGFRYRCAGGSAARSHDFVLAHNIYKAVDWWQKAAEMGNAEAQYKLGELYYKLYDDFAVSPLPLDPELTWEKRISEAEKLFKAAAAQGHERAAVELANLRKSKAFYNELKKDGAYLSFFKYSDKYELEPEYRIFCIRDFEPDRDRVSRDTGDSDKELKPSELLRKDADKGYFWAQCRLAEMYLGKSEADEAIAAMSVADRMSEAERWYAAAAQNGGEDVKKQLDELRRNCELWKKAGTGCVDGGEEYELSKLYGSQYGILFDRDPEKAQEWLVKAARDGCAEAQYELGEAIMKNVQLADPVSETDFAKIESLVREAEKWFKASADKGNEEAAKCLAQFNTLSGVLAKAAKNSLCANDEYELYLLSEIRPFSSLLSWDKKDKLLIRAAECGSSKACEELIARGDDCINNIHRFASAAEIEARIENTREYYRKAAECGSSAGKTKLEEFNRQPEEEKQTIKELSERLKKNNADTEAALRLASLYARSLYHRDEDKALQYYYQGALHGSLEAMEELYRRSDVHFNKWEENRYRNRFSRLDEAECRAKLTELQKKAAGGDIEAEYKLGWLYYAGKTGQSSSEKVASALKCWRQAADQGHAGAKFCLSAYNVENGAADAKSTEESKKWLAAAADRGEVYAEYLLALDIFCGFDEAANCHSDSAKDFDLKKAFRLCSQAAEQGCGDAQLLLGIAYARGLGVEADPAAAEYWYGRADQSGEHLAVFYSFLTKTGLIRYRSTPGCMNGLY